MRVVVCKDSQSLGEYASAETAAALNGALQASGRARLLLSTGQSQFETLSALVRRPVDWARVDCFHLDEYVGLPTDHPASFRLYLKERVADLVPVNMHYVPTSSCEELVQLGELIASAPIDVALVGIGENGHLAFNDPPADLVTTAPYLEVELAPRCREQQVREGWFRDVSEVPKRAITMSIYRIMQSRKIISAVPNDAKAAVVRNVLGTPDATPDLPASVLHGHPDVAIFLDRASSRLLPNEIWHRCIVL